ncbi:MAG: hypothetical protein R2706_00225 [Acidimicrobiales bacterium]
MRKPSGQTLITLGALTIAGCALVLASLYSGSSTNNPVINAGATAGGPDGIGITPVEGWFPRTGQGGACSEQVGIDLIDGYAATLTINGIPIPPDEMNTFAAAPTQASTDDDAGDNGQTRSTVISADGSLGRYTWGPEEDCPGGEILRAQDNTVVACVYEINDNPSNCLPYSYTFDVL